FLEVDKTQILFFLKKNGKGAFKKLEIIKTTNYKLKKRMPYKAFVCLEKERHEVTLAFLRLKSLKEKVLEIIRTTNSKAIYFIPYFKITDNNGQYITSNKELMIAFKTKPVLFFIHLIQNNNDDDDEKKYPKNEFHKIILIIHQYLLQQQQFNYQLPEYDVPFSIMINSNQYMKNKLIFGSYSVSSFHSKKIIFDNITIDGCVYD
ncbi:hypothetical protein RFI_37145, partial [Reticulomyxa filosa]